MITIEQFEKFINKYTFTNIPSSKNGIIIYEIAIFADSLSFAYNYDTGNIFSIIDEFMCRDVSEAFIDIEKFEKYIYDKGYFVKNNAKIYKRSLKIKNL